MHSHILLLERFYEAFQHRNPEAMAACYHPEAHFSDPVFPHLRGRAIGQMWTMLVARGGKEMMVRYDHRDVAADDYAGQARWEAHYKFSQTGRRVHNIIDAKFTFADGLILDHQDHFDFARWARQALGFTGLLLGNTQLLQRQVQRKAAASLTAWQAANP